MMSGSKPFRVIYCEDNGAPNTPVNIIVGACIILRRKYHVDNLPRGKTHGGLFFGFKIGALNFKKLFTYRTGSGHYAPNPVIA